MKTFLLLTSIVIIFTNCSHQSAFSYFNITPKQAKSEESIQSSEIYNEEHISGIVSALYLNSIMPQEYNGDEYFYAYLYCKNDDQNITFILNKKKALQVTELPNPNRFSHLISSNPQWKKYYLVKFSEEGNLLNFQVKLSKSSSKKMIYIKNP